MDYSEWLTPERLAIEEKAWAEAPHEPAQAKLVAEACDTYGLRSVVEVGCATGWLPHYLSGGFEYVGIDANELCLEKARERNPGLIFIQRDVRAVDGPQADLVVAFAFLKHFSLREWDDVTKRVLSLGEYALFSMPVAEECREDDWEFTHVWATRERLEQVAKDAGHEVLRYPWGEDLETEWMVLTRRKEG